MEHAASAQNEQGGARVRVPPPLVFLALALAGIVLQPVTGWLALPLPPWLRALGGAALALAGAAVVLSAQTWFKRTGQHPAPWKPSPELLVQGIYRYTRNPMYLGMTLFQVGLSFAFANGWIAALAPLALLIVHFTAVRAEEAYLAERFGESYLRYKATVRRYL